MSCAASRNAAISACAVGSRDAIGALLPRPTIRPSQTTTAPTGTSPRSAAAVARRSASCMKPASTSVATSLTAVLEMEPMHQAMKDRRDEHGGCREQDHAGIDRIKRLEDLAGVAVHEGIDRPHARQDQRGLVKRGDPTDRLQHLVADGADRERAEH